MWKKLFVLQVLIILIAYPNPSLSSTNLPSFIKTIGDIDDSKKIAAYCDSNDIKFSTKWKPKIQLIDLQSCDNSQQLITLKLPKLLNESPSCFVVVIRSNVIDNDFQRKLRDVLEEQVDRPIIVNFFNKNSKTEKIYVVDKKNTAKALEYAENFIETVISHDNGDDDSSFSNNRSEIIKEAMTNRCPLCIKFAQLVDYRYVWYLKIHEDQVEDLKCDEDCFKAILNVPHDFDFDSSYSSVYKLIFNYYIELLKDSSESALSIDEDFTVKDFLKENEVQLDLDGLVALAWLEQEYKVFNFLIRADLPFPQNFLQDRKNELSYGANKHKYHKKLETYIEEIETFHRHIRKGNFKRIKQFLSENKHLTFARNLSNKSALKVAFDSNQLEVFSYLRSQGMNFANFKEVAEYYRAKNKFKDNKRKQMRQFNRKFLTPAIETDFITKLMQKSLFTFDHHTYSENDVRYTIKRCYEKIEVIAREILEIAAGSNELQIIFDFTNSDLVEFDPYINDAYGAAYNYYDFIIIAAKDLMSSDVDKKNYALGTLSHELMHYTMHQMYQNNISPYDERDYERMVIFRDIYRKYEDYKDEDSLIKSAYKGEENENSFGELIARVPDILFTYKDNQPHLDELKETFKDLFKFYEQYVLADMREFIPTIHIREKVRELNDWLDLVSDIELYDIEHANEEETDDNEDENQDDENQVEETKKNEEIVDEEELPEVLEIENYLNEDTADRLRVFTSTNPKLLLQKLYYRLRKSKTLAIYVASSFSYYGNFEQVMYKIDTIHPSVPLIINCDRIMRLRKFVKMLQKTTFRKVVAIADKVEFEKKVTSEKLESWIEESRF